MKIHAHVLIGDEETYIRKAILSVYDFVDKFQIIDTGSTDNTISSIQSIPDPGNKIVIWDLIVPPQHCEVLTLLRNAQLFCSLFQGADWFMVLDGHEVWDRKDIEHITQKSIPSGNYDIIATGYHNLTGPRMVDRKNSYEVHWPYENVARGYRIVRFFNLKTIPGIHWGDMFPREAILDAENKEVVSNYRLHIEPEIRFFHYYYDRSPNDGKYGRQVGIVAGAPLDVPDPEVRGV